TVETHGTKNVENISETRKDRGVCSTLKSEKQVKNDKYCTQEDDINEDSELVGNEKENAMVFHKNDRKVTSTNLDINESRRFDESFPIAKQDSFSSFVGFTSAGGKKINISKAALNRSAELFRDLDDDNYLFKSSETGTRCHNLNRSMSSNSNFSRCLTKESKERTIRVSDFKSMNAVSHTGSVSYHTQNKNEENTSTAFKENMENKTKISINNTEDQNYKTSKQILNRGDDEGNLQDHSLGVTCLGAVTAAEERSLNTSYEMVNQSPKQKGEDREEDECFSPKLQTPAGEKTNCKNMEEDTMHDKDLLANESRIKIGSYHHYQIPLEQEVNVGKNEVEGSYLTGFHTASGKKIAVADGFLAKAEQFFADVDVGKDHNDNFENLIKKRKCGKNCIKQSDASTSNSGFFSTASGKPVQLSEESLRQARQLFSEMEGNHSPHVREAFLVEEDVEKSKMHTEVVPRKMQVVSSNREENTSPEFIPDSAFGFSTASGKQVKVSKDAYQKAKAILEESDYFSSSGLCTTDQLSSIKDSGQHIKSLTDKAISEFKTEKSCNQDSDFKSICPQEIEYFPSTYHVKIPEHTPYNQKIKLLTSFKNNFQQEETESFGKGQLNLESKPESEAISCSATAKAEINTNLFQNQKNYLEVEAVESARAFMEDSFSSSGVQINAAQTFSGRLDKNFQSKTFGKRHFEENSSFGEPPIKRQLLLEFNRTKNSPRSLKASKSTPDGIFKDRRKFMYHVPLKPIICQPSGSTTERQEVRSPTLTLPDQDFRGFQSKPAIFQHRALRHSSDGAAGVSTPCKASAKESEKTQSLYESGKAAKTFIPPFKTKLTFSTCEQGSSKRCDSLISKNMTKEMDLNQIRTEQNTADAQDHQSCIQHAADTDLENGNLAMARMVTNLRCARDLQEMRIKKKRRQNIRSQPGTLYVIKTSASNRISLKTAVEEKSPSFYSTEELYTYGVSKQCVQVNSTNAESFQFLIKDFFSKEYLLAGNGMQLADGGWLIPTDEGKAGKKEFYRALCDTPGVDPNLITEAWVYNHYRWIVWKLAAMEVSFPHEFANRCLTPEMVLLQLKYRYDLEVDKSKRSAIRKIMERDDAAGKTLVLCISKIISLNTVVSPSSSNKNMESKKAAALIEVTDGWYGIRALLDPPLKAFLDRRRLTVGQKIIVHGAELVGPQNGCTPLEAPDSLMLKISANSTRRVRWHTKLGFHRDPRPFPLPLSSLHGEGGAVGCIDVVIQRTYPIQWVEKTSAGSYIFRNSRAEEREAAKHAEDQQKKMEALFAKIQAEYEEHEERTRRRTPRSQIVTRQQIHNLQDGAELYEAIQNASDPDYMEGYLNDDQLKALKAYRQLMNDKKQTQMQEQFKKALESAEQEENGCYKRDVSAVWRLYVVDYRKQETHKGAVLSVWRPLPDVCSLLKEGARYRIFQLSASQSRGRADSANIQLTATKKTQYRQLPVSQETLVRIFFPRKALEFTSLLDPSFQPPCAEVDLVGVVVSVSRTGFTTVVYLSDESYNLVAVKIWTDLRHLAIEDVVVRCSLISASNLQWQSEFRSEIPVLLAGDLSLFSASPRECYLQEKVNELRRVIENVASFCSDAENKLMNLLRRNLLLAPGLTKRCGLESPSPSCSYAEDRSLISSRIERGHPSPLSTSTPHMKLVTPGSAKTPSPATVNEDHLKTSKKRKAMDFLSCIPAPPPLTPICSVISPSVKRAFQPPRTLGLQHSKSPKETDQNIGHVTPCRRVRETVHLPENDLVADEELAMINTQALMNNLPEEKKMDHVNENSNATATTLSDDLSSRNSSSST
ncbi:BRCA2 protein, partial [Tichodroma muraria]|nr:BRCA2 protein [Tichodroma muraria]